MTNMHNVRSSVHTFHIPNGGVCHGLAGYFEAHLYGDVHCSIHPDPSRGSKDMLSWFPIFFPFKVRCSKLSSLHLIFSSRSSCTLRIPSSCPPTRS